MPVGDIVRINSSGEHNGRYGQVTQEDPAGATCTVEFEDDRKRVGFPASEVEFVRRGPFCGNLR